MPQEVPFGTMKATGKRSAICLSGSMTGSKISFQASAGDNYPFSCRGHSRLTCRIVAIVVVCVRVANSDLYISHCVDIAHRHSGSWDRRDPDKTAVRLA
jgi:hypothetical protein